MYFTCQYCNSKFSREKNYNKHFCEAKKKALLVKTKMGRSAFNAYREWNKLRGYKATDEGTFVTSKYFKAFINFIDFANTKMLPDKTGFMKLMIKKEILPTSWTNELYYEFYIDQFDDLYSPIKQVELSLDFLTKLSQAMDCTIPQVIYKLEPIELMRFISARKLSPWFLLFMKSFQDYVRYHLKGEAKLLMETVISASFWKEKFNQNAAVVKKVKDLMTDLNM